MDAVLYAEKKCFLLNIPLKVTLYTNGILLDDDIIDFLSNHQIHVVISLDGPKIIHDHNRTLINGTSGFVTVVRNVRKMIDIGMGHLLESRAVINDPKTSLIDVMEANFVEGFTRIQLMPAYGLKRKIISNIDNWLSALKVYEKLLQNGVVIEVSPFYTIFRKLYFPTKFINSYFPCSTGWNMLGVGSDGYYYLCHHFSGSDQKLGQVGKGLPVYDSYHSLTQSVEQREPCRYCWARHLCGGPCYHREYIGGGPHNLGDCSEWLELLREITLTFYRLSIKAPDVMRTIGEGSVYVPKKIRTSIKEYRPYIDSVE